MYRATAEIVDGLKVFAGGKWLTCIGNKNVRVGDRIWTDGRCVYGYHQENSSPIVITTSKTEDIVIPIAANLTTDKHKLLGYNFFAKNTSLQETGSHAEEHGFGNQCLMINNEHSAIIVTPERNISSEGIQLINTFAANLDNNDNVYLLNIVYPEIEYQYNEYDVLLRAPGYNEVFTRSWLTNHTATVDKGWAIQITKNNSAVLSVDIGNIFEQEIRAASVVHNFEIRYSVPQVFYAFIENEKNWGALIYIHASSFECYNVMLREYNEGQKNGLDGYELFPGVGESGFLFPDSLYDWRMMIGAINGYYNVDGRQTEREVGGFYYISPAGIQRIWHSVETVYYPVSSAAGGGFETKENTAEEENYILPLQDGCSYSFKILQESYSHAVGYRLWNVWAIYTVYNPERHPLFKGIFPVGTYFSIYRIKSNRYLFGVKFAPLSSSYSPSVVKSSKYDVPVYEQGLYTLVNGTLSVLQTNKNFSCLNQRLRPMKQYRNWWERIKILE